MGPVIVQQNQPVAYFSRKLNSAQRSYTTIEKIIVCRGSAPRISNFALWWRHHDSHRSQKSHLFHAQHAMRLTLAALH
jgi:hypothetical protein